MKKFIELDKYGQLYIDKVLFESYFPVVFTCINDNKDIFIGVCCQNNEKGCKWLLGKTNGISVVKMLRDEITIRQLLLEFTSEKISVDYTKDGYAIAYNNSDWDENSPYLPKVDSYMYAEAGEFENEINYLSSLDYHVPYNAECYKCIAEALGTVNEGIESMADALAVFPLDIGSVSIPGEVVSTFDVSGKVPTDLVINTEKYRNQEKYKLIYNNTFSMLPEDLGIKVESDNNNYVDAA